MVQAGCAYVLTTLTVALFSQAYLIYRRGMEWDKDTSNRAFRVALGWPVLAIAGFVYFVAMGIIYVAEGSLSAAQARLDGTTTNIDPKGER